MKKLKFVCLSHHVSSREFVLGKVSSWQAKQTNNEIHSLNAYNQPREVSKQAKDHTDQPLEHTTAFLSSTQYETLM